MIDENSHLNLEADTALLLHLVVRYFNRADSLKKCWWKVQQSGMAGSPAAVWWLLGTSDNRIAMERNSPEESSEAL